MSNLVLVPNDPYGMGFIDGKNVIATSRSVAEMFGKRHDDVLKAVRNSGCSDEFRHRNFAESYYMNDQNKKQPQVLLTKDGFAFVVFGFTGKKAAQFKELYINRFNEMENALADRNKAKMESRLLTDAIKSAHDPVKSYHFSNEMNMILQIATGKQAKQLKAERNLPDNAQVRDYLSPQEIKIVQHLQPIAAYLNHTTPDYQDRKRLLQEYAGRLSTLQIAQ